MAATELPAAIAQLASALADLPGVEAVVLGGSRATGEHRPDSDWDLGLYYRASHGSFDPAALRELGHDGYVSALGEWGPIVHGGAWLTVDGMPVDVIFRDLDTVERWLREAEAGRFEVLVQNGSIVGAPTYAVVGELAICRPLFGELPRPAFPDALAAGAATWWSGRAAVSLMFAAGYAESGDAVCCTGMLVDAALCTAHARLAERREWGLNEKRLLQRAGLGELQRLLAPGAAGDAGLPATVAAVSAILRVDPLRAR
ncbi:nucleotidyltransferase domain-containing protein [Conexibacter stalactiti]|uniref:Nucleotidyltransferase domain-containing protein n=1 Tax=Conexibacter stalactiti TaxID=1940611 RepID=A0ABU4HSX1_9ACTN|nr:nucleotidyltransferase domain-containing protein [Conexibacter stalactiti]MDW5596417.1 nucleotidyltransferase domain-containing protein [Conexibacter stalactiti]MEC5037059.1 nucleotidyltransferase domain-containing protein [Conexibacter stalactiti]